MSKYRQTSQSFSRDRKLSFKDIYCIILGLSRVGIQTELDRFFKARNSLSGHITTITKSAFTQARKKLKPEAFIATNKEILKEFYENATKNKKWKGKRIVAIDGSLLNLPVSNEIENHFGGVNNQYEEIVSARCSFAYDVCNELILDAKVDKRRSCEKELAVSHFEALNPDTDIIVFDRGYPAQWLIGLLNTLGFSYCFRLSTAWKEAYASVDGNSDIDWTLKWSSHKALGKMKTYNIPKEIEGLRLIGITLTSGEKEVLLTNLTDRTEFSYDDIKELYRKRWGVEEGFKQLKKILFVEHFSGKTVLSIYQDFNAKVQMLNLASIIRTQSIKTKKGKNKYDKKVNKTQTLAKLKDYLIEIFYGEMLRPTICRMLLVLAKCMDIIRDNRTFPRNGSSARRRVKTLNYRGI